MIIDCACSPFEFAPVRTLLAKVGYHARSLPERLALALVDPLDEQVFAARGASHLTDSASQDKQLRFYSDRMVHQRIRTLSRSFAMAHSQIESIEIRHCENMHEGSRLFFQLLARHLPRCEIQLRFGGSSAPDLDECLTTAERSPRDLYLRTAPLDDDEFARLFETARRCSYVGDYWTSARLLEKLERQRPHREVNVLLGIAANAKADPFRAEYYYLRNYRDDHVVDKVRACYSLSMLCIRHHSPAFRDIDRGEDYLQEAHALLQAADPNDDDEDLAFRKVFNRNGHALVLFKRNQVRGALAQLDRGIARLGELSGEAVPLHLSVLTYNAMLCHRALGEFDAERERFDALVRLDPLYPYYRFDYANGLRIRGLLDEAAEVALGGQHLDPFLAEGHALIGRCRREQGRLREAEQCFRRAHDLDPLDPYYLCNLGSLWNALDEHQRTHDALASEDIDAWNDASFESAITLRAESSLMVHQRTDEAVAILEHGLSRRASSEPLLANLRHINAIEGAR